MARTLKKEEIEIVTQAAIAAALEYLAAETQKQQKFKQDKRLRNTKLLLKHYRSFVAHGESLQSKLNAIEEAETLNELHVEEFAVEAIRRSERRTLVMVRFIQQMLAVYRSMCESSPQAEDMRRYRVIEALYISDKMTTAEKLAEQVGVEPRTIYNDINNACKVLSVLMFGVDGIRLE